MKFDSLIVGGGLAGLVCGIRCAQAGLKTGLVSRGESGLAFASGTIDVLGFDQDGSVLQNPFAGIEPLVTQNPDHPYSKVGLGCVVDAVNWFQQLSVEMEMSYQPLADGANHQRFTALGAFRPTYLSPSSMSRLPVIQTADPIKRLAVVNIEGFRDFQSELAASNLQKQPEFAGVDIISKTIRLPASIMGHRDPNTMRSVELSRQLDNEPAMSVLAHTLKAAIGEVELVLIPSVLSMDHGIERTRQLSELSGYPICELATLPPSLPGIRLSNRLQRRFNRLGGLMIAGDHVQSGVIADGRIQSFSTHNNSQMPLTADHVVLATGSFMSSGLVADRNKIREAIFDLDVNTQLSRTEWANEKFLNGKAHAFAGFGVVTDEQLRPRKAGETIGNLYCIGSLLGHAQPVEESSAGGIAIATGWSVAENIIQLSQIKKRQLKKSQAKSGAYDYVC